MVAPRHLPPAMSPTTDGRNARWNRLAKLLLAGLVVLAAFGAQPAAASGPCFVDYDNPGGLEAAWVSADQLSGDCDKGSASGTGYFSPDGDDSCLVCS